MFMSHAAITAAQLEAAARTLDLLSTPNRLNIVLHLLDGPQDVSTLAEHIGASVTNTSQQLAKLRAAGLVSAVRDGRHQHYQVNDPHIAEIVEQVLRHIRPDGSVAGHDDHVHS